MKSYTLALSNAKQFVADGKKNVRIAKAKRKNSYIILFDSDMPTKNYEVVKTLD